MMLEKGIACVTVGFPATGLTGARVRFCISAAHTREMLDMVNKIALFIDLIDTSFKGFLDLESQEGSFKQMQLDVKKKLT